MNWKQASLAQLYEIAYNDLDAPLKYRLAAGEEIKTRARQRKYTRTNYKEKVVYQR